MAERFEVALTADFLAEGKLVFKDIGLGILEKAGIRYRFLDSPRPVLLAEQVEGFDALICLTPRVTAESLARAGRFLAVARFGVGFDGVDVRACTDAGVALFITKGAVDHSVAEAILGWMLGLGHHVLQKDRLTRGGKWSQRNDWMGSELRGRVIGIIGLGGIGGRLATLLRPLGVAEIIAFDPYVDQQRAASLQVQLVELRELLAKSDYLAVCCPLNEETRGLLGSDELSLMKRSAFLINTARGGIVEESALVDALQSRRVAGAAIDVFANEPVDSGHPLCQLDNVILAPHSIAWTDELFAEVGSMCASQIVRLAGGSVPAGLVNEEVLEQPAFREKLRRFQ